MAGCIEHLPRGAIHAPLDLRDPAFDPDPLADRDRRPVAHPEPGRHAQQSCWKSAQPITSSSRAAKIPPWTTSAHPS